MEKKLLKFKSWLLLLCMIVGATSSALADSYTITFSIGSGDGTTASTSTACSTIVSDGNTYLSGNLVTATKVYYGGSDGLKMGTSSAVGAIKMNLASNVTPTSIVVNAKLYNSSKAATLKVNGSTAQNISSSFSDLTFNITSEISYIQLETSKYCWIKSITVNYAAAAKEDPEITFNNGSVKVGNTLDLSTLFTSNSAGAVTYSITAGDSYATIAGSTLTGKAEGSVTVKAEQAAAGNYNAGEASATITVNAALALSSIEITTPPTKTTYTEGETFDPTGMVVTATYSDSSTGEVTASCTFSPSTSTALTTSDTEITVSYTENAVEKTATQAITVNAIPTHTVTFSINGDVSRTASVEEDETITFPTAADTPSDASEFNKTLADGKTFVGWYTAEYSHSTNAPASYVNTSTTTMSTNDVTYYAVYADVEIAEGSYTLDYNNESSLSGSTSWGSYGKTYNYTASDGSTWTIKAYKSSGMQINTGKDCSIKVPSCPGNIQSIAITCSAAKAVGFSSSDYTGSGTITYLASGTDKVSQTLDLTSKSVTTGYIVPKSGSTSITKIVVSYRNVNASNFTTDNRASAGIAYANASVDVKLTSGYTGQALTNTNSVSVTYSSSDESVATINSSTGAITELLKAGTTTITATFAGNATYKPAEASYDLNVTEKTPCGLAYATGEVAKLTTDAAFTNTLTNGYSLTVSYESSDEEVATVNSSTGEVTIKGAGEATITATFAGDEDYEAGNARYTLTVSKADPTLEFAYANATGREGEAFAGNALTNPTGLTVSYSSSDKSVATVDEETGAITIVATGTTTITATFAGNETYNAANASYTLKVLETPTISVSDDDVAYGETFTVDDSDITGGPITVTSGNTAIATVSGLVITPIACGEVEITVSTAEDETYKAGNATFTLTITAPDGEATAPSSDVPYTFDFTNNSEWGLPTGSSNKTTASIDYTADGKTINLVGGGSSNGYYFNSDGYLMLGKTDATLTLPAFEYDVTKIDVQMTTGTSSNVSINVYVGSNEVSTATTGGGKKSFAISKANQEAGTIYAIKVKNGYNAQIESVTIHQYVAPTATVILNKYGYATYCSVNPMDFSSTEGYTAWRVNSIASDGTITFKKITEAIKGGQGVLLYNKNADGENTSNVTVNFANSSTVFDNGSDENNENDNLLIGTTALTYLAQIVGDNTNFGLSANTLKKIANGTTIGANKAYLPVPSSIVNTLSGSSVKSFTLVFEDETTGITETRKATREEVEAIFNLAGQRLNRTQKGINIVNGKKILVK